MHRALSVVHTGDGDAGGCAENAVTCAPIERTHGAGEVHLEPGFALVEHVERMRLYRRDEPVSALTSFHHQFMYY